MQASADESKEKTLLGQENRNFTCLPCLEAQQPDHLGSSQTQNNGLEPPLLTMATPSSFLTNNLLHYQHLEGKAYIN